MMRKACVFLSCLPIACASAQPLVSSFDASREGWTVETRTVPTGPFTLVQTYTPDFIATGGDPGGYLEELDPDSNYSFFASPDAWAGNRSALLGARLSYSTRTSVQNFADGRLVVLFGGGLRISHATPLPPINTWVRRSIPLTVGSWYVGSTGSGTLATQAQLTTVLSSFTRLLIGMEFGGEALEERVGLDRVLFGACPADFNEDGFLDFFDYDDYVTCFETGACPPGRTADFNGDAFVDFFDYDDFVTAFEAGC